MNILDMAFVLNSLISLTAILCVMYLAHSFRQATRSLVNEFAKTTVQVTREGFAAVVANHPFEAQQALAMRDANDKVLSTPVEEELPQKQYVRLRDGTRLEKTIDDDGRTILRDVHGKTFEPLAGQF